MLRLLLVGSLCCGCFFLVELWDNGALRSGKQGKRCVEQS
jgi:hypothetical protein